MAGVVIGAFANAAIMVLLARSDVSTVRGALWWMMGSVANATWTQSAWLAGYLLLGGALLVAYGRSLDALALGEDSAAGLGIEVDRTARRVYIAASFVAAATVAAAGLVGFVGLVVPHIARRLGDVGHCSSRALSSGRFSWCLPTSLHVWRCRQQSFPWGRSPRSWACRSSSSLCGG
jgi:iron complex transport system permease protein